MLSLTTSAVIDGGRTPSECFVGFAYGPLYLSLSRRFRRDKQTIHIKLVNSVIVFVYEQLCHSFKMSLGVYNQTAPDRLLSTAARHRYEGSAVRVQNGKHMLTISKVG